MGILRELNRSGDTETEWNATTKLGVAEAMERFNAMMSKGGHAYAFKEEGGKATATREFDPTAHEIVVHEQLQGG